MLITHSTKLGVLVRSAKDPCLAHLAKCSFFLAASHQFTFSAEHILRVCNRTADVLSHNRLDLFHSHFSQVSPPPTSIPPPLLNLLLVQWTSPPLLNLLLETPIQWTSPHWRKLFANTMVWVYPQKKARFLNFCSQYRIPVILLSEKYSLFVGGTPGPTGRVHSKDSHLRLGSMTFIHLYRTSG